MSESNEHTKELEQLRIKETYLEVINSFATVLFEAQSIDEIVWAVAKHAIAKLNYYDCVIYLYDEEVDKLIQKAAYGPKSKKEGIIFTPIDIRPGEGIVGKVFQTGIGEIIADTSKDPRYLVDDEARLSEITIPLSYKGKIVGVIDSEHPSKNFFNEQDFKMLTTVAAMVSTKIEQARTNEEVIAYQQNLELLVSEQTAELEEANSVLKLQNKEKETLIKEIHHRVKNNMQIMISLLNLQMNTTDDLSVKNLLLEFQNRIRSMAIIHERLYLAKDISSIAIDEYISELSFSLLSTFKKNESVKLETSIEKLQFDLDVAIPLGLIINELITNSLKHAFQSSESGQINVILSKNESNGIYFEYSDNGTGFKLPKGKTESFGLELIGILIDQLGGTFTLNSEKGVQLIANLDIQPKTQIQL